MGKTGHFVDGFAHDVNRGAVVHAADAGSAEYH